MAITRAVVRVDMTTRLGPEREGRRLLSPPPPPFSGGGDSGVMAHFNQVVCREALRRLPSLRAIAPRVEEPRVVGPVEADPALRPPYLTIISFLSSEHLD